MPGAPRFTQKPSIQQTATGDLLMECHLEADPPPEVKWHHSGQLLTASSRVIFTLTNLQGILYKATLVIKEPNANDGGAYKCTASNQLGESNANINLNFAGGGEEKETTPSSKGPTFVGKPRIIPKDGGVLILMECKVKSLSRPTAKWSKDGVTLTMGSLYQDVFTDLGDNTYLCQLEIRRPSANEAGQYRCNIKNDQGETNANLSLNFQQEEAQEERRSPSVGRKSPRPHSRPTTPSKRHREGTPGDKDKEKKKKVKDRAMSKEGTPKRSLRSRPTTPEVDATGNTLQPPGTTERMETDETTTTKRRSDAGLPPKSSKRERSRSRSPVPPKEAKTEFTRAPVVMEPLKSTVARAGETVVLECELQCHSSTKITWTKESRRIETSSEYSQSFDGRTARLSIRHMSEEKSGLYQCLAESEYGNAQSSAMVKYEASQEEKQEKRRSSLRKSSLDKSEKDDLKRKAGQSQEDQVVPEKLKSFAGRSPRGSVSSAQLKSQADDESSKVEDEIPDSGLKIPEDIRRELLQMGGGGNDGGDSEDEITESISELPSFGGGKSLRSAAKKVPQVGKREEEKKESESEVSRAESISNVESMSSLASTSTSKRISEQNGDESLRKKVLRKKLHESEDAKQVNLLFLKLHRIMCISYNLFANRFNKR
uniref:Ig-like domain-containing protein n=1 Tax=Acrobeloides nanus TaxID=290746 RepID=A0A914C5C4_9BILA